jgi:hypothetical protein
MMMKINTWPAVVFANVVGLTFPVNVNWKAPTRGEIVEASKAIEDAKETMASAAPRSDSMTILVNADTKFA